MFMDDLAIAEVAYITTMTDQWLINNNKNNCDLKAWLKKAKEAKQK